MAARLGKWRGPGTQDVKVHLQFPVSLFSETPLLRQWWRVSLNSEPPLQLPQRGNSSEGSGGSAPGCAVWGEDGSYNHPYSAFTKLLCSANPRPPS